MYSMWLGSRNIKSLYIITEQKTAYQPILIIIIIITIIFIIIQEILRATINGS